MEFLTQLWLPIVLSAVFVFIVSSILHMVVPWHKGDVRKLPNEDAVLETLRAGSVPAGSYMFPGCDSMKEMSSPEMIARRKNGPNGWLVMLPPGGCNLGLSLALWFVYCLIVGVLVAYVSWHGLGAGAQYLKVFQLAGSAAVLGYALGAMQDSIWKGQAWPITCKFIIDGVIYALFTAGTFGWLWPALTTPAMPTP